MAEQTNPYLALLQQERPRGNPWDLLSNALLGVGSGISQAGASGAGWGAGIAPGLMLGNQMTAQAEHAAEQERMRRLQIGIAADKWDEERKLRQQQQAAIEAYAKGPGVPGVTAPAAPSGTPTPGMNVQPPPYQVGPGGDYDQRTRGLESRGGQMIFNELGSGAFGPYQFMPGTWADVRAKNPNLQLPEDMTKATREQHDAAHGAFKQGNAAILQQAGFQPTPENLYLAHRFGAGGALSVLRADPNKPLHEVLPVDWQRQNPDMRGQTVGGFQRLATERMGGVGVPYQVPPDAKPTPYALQFGSLPPFVGPGMGERQPGATDLPEVTAPVMPQPQWPTLAQQPPQQQPPQVAQGGGGPTTSSGAPYDPNAQPPAFVTGQPSTPGGPNVVQAQYQPQPGTPSMSPTAPPPRLRALPPELEARINGLVAMKAITIPQAEKMKQEAQTAQYQGDLKAWEVGQTLTTEQRKIDAQKAAEQRKLETELVTVRDRTSNELKSVTKAEAVAGVSNGRYIPMDAESAKRAEEAATLARENAARAAANQDVIIGPDGQPVINEKAVEAKTRISAAQGTDPSSKVTLELVQDAIKRNSEIQKAGAAAGSTIRNMDIFNRLSEEVKTGKYAGATIDLKAALKGAGFNLEAWGIPDKIGPAQAMQMMSQRFALEMRQEMPGPMSDGDRKFMERGSISIENDPNANKIMATWLKGNAERAQDRAKFAREYIRSADFKTDPAGMDDYIEQKLAGKDYFDHSVLPKESPAAKSPWELEQERRGKMNSAKPKG